MKNILKVIMGLIILLVLLTMIFKGYKTTDIAVAFIGMAITTDVIIDGMDYLLDKAKGD